MIIFFNDLHDEEEEFDVYQYSEFFPDSNHTESGFSRMKKTLKSQEYLSYHNEESGSMVFISNIGGDQYKCTGNCYCSTSSENQRKSSLLLNQGLFILLSAFSVTVALEMAKETFRNNCIQKFSDVCDEDGIHSEEERCRIVDELTKEYDELAEKWVEEAEEGTYNRYRCFGYCVDNPDFEPMRYPIEGISDNDFDKEKFGCKKYSMEQNMRELYPRDIKLEVVIFEFETEYLHWFCEDRSYEIHPAERSVLKKLEAVNSKFESPLHYHSPCVSSLRDDDWKSNMKCTIRDD